MVIIAYIFIFFGTNYSSLLLRLLFGSLYSSPHSSSLLSLYCIYVGLLGVNGITEVRRRGRGKGRGKRKRTTNMLFFYQKKNNNNSRLLSMPLPPPLNSPLSTSSFSFLPSSLSSSPSGWWGCGGKEREQAQEE